jgi:hypothetical protein
LQIRPFNVPEMRFYTAFILLTPPQARFWAYLTQFSPSCARILTSTPDVADFNRYQAQTDTGMRA